jgi:hypothetical protein
MFFPESVSALQEDRNEINIEIDVSDPILMGYIFSRPDEIIKGIPSSAQRTNKHGSRGDDCENSDDEDGENHYKRRRWICRRYFDDLRWACGDTYAEVAQVPYDRL